MRALKPEDITQSVIQSFADTPDPRLREIMRAALFVPESQAVDDLLNELERRRGHMAIVLDEYG